MLTRRQLLAGAAATVAAAPLSRLARAGAAPSPWAGLRKPGSLPRPGVAMGTADASLPFDHVVVVMMENHSFDNYFGMLPQRGQPLADGFSFDAAGNPTNANPAPGGQIRCFRMPTACQMESEPSQAWDATHIEVDGGRMDGFVVAPNNGDVAMGYWDDATLPFYYGLARTFCLANRWFPSCPGQTYPNRRFLMAGTAYGLVDTTLPSPTDAGPPNGTIFDRLDAAGLDWADYYTDLPQTFIIPSIVTAHPQRAAKNLRPISRFYADCAAGTLPAVSFVDPDFGLADVIGGLVPGQPVPEKVRAQGQDEENPQDVQLGEQFVSGVVNAVLQSPAWPRTLLVWCYDEHGGYYDHVPPPAAVPPDDIAPSVGLRYGGYDRYGVRVPSVVVSPYAKPHAVTDVVHDHTSILATIEAKWNLPALTYRDANAATLVDFLDLSSAPAFLTPPALPAPGLSVTEDAACSTADPGAPVTALGESPWAVALPVGAAAAGAWALRARQRAKQAPPT